MVRVMGRAVELLDLSRFIFGTRRSENCYTLGCEPECTGPQFRVPLVENYTLTLIAALCFYLFRSFVRVRLFY